MAECVKVSRSEIRMGVHSVILTHKKNTPCYFTTSHNILHSGNTDWWPCKVENPGVGAEGGMMKLVYDVWPPVDDEDALDFNVFEANLLVQGDAKTKPLVYRTRGSSKNTVVGEVHHAGLFVGAYLERVLYSKLVSETFVEVDLVPQPGIGSLTRPRIMAEALLMAQLLKWLDVVSSLAKKQDPPPLLGIHPLHVLVDIGTCESMREHHSCHKMAIFQCNE